VGSRLLSSPGPGIAILAVIASVIKRRRSNRSPFNSPRAGGSIVTRAFETQLVAANHAFDEAPVAADGTTQVFCVEHDFFEQPRPDTKAKNNLGF